MADEQTPNDTNATPTTPAVATPAATSTPVLTQADIEAARKQAHDAAWADARRTFEAKQKPNGASPKPEGQPPAHQHASPPDVHQLVNRALSFDRALRKYELSDSAARIIEREFASASDADPIAWVTERAEAFGWKATGQPSTPAAQPAQPAPPASNAAPVTGNGAPSSPVRVTDDTPILRLSTADQIALRKQIGDKAFTDRMMKEFREHGTRVRLR